MPQFTTTLGALAALETVLRRLADPEVKLSAQAQYDFTTLVPQAAAKLAHYHEKRNEMIRELGFERPAITDKERQDAGGNPIVQVREESVPEFCARHAELCAVVVTLDYSPIRLSELRSMDFSYDEMTALKPFITRE